MNSQIGNIVPDTIKFVSEDLNETTKVKLDFETTETKVNELFQKTVIEQPIPTLSKQEIRELRKKEKLKEKSQKVEKSKKRPTFEVVIPVTKKVSGAAILALRFSQDSIKGETQDGMSLDKLIENMKTKGWKTGTVLTVVKMPDDTYLSMDNRRLYAAKKVYEETQSKEFEINVNIFNHSDKAPKSLLSGVINEYKKGRSLTNTDKVARSIIQNSYGHCAVLRLHTRQGELDSEVYGYSDNPVVRE